MMLNLVGKPSMVSVPAVKSKLSDFRLKESTTISNSYVDIKRYTQQFCTTILKSWSVKIYRLASIIASALFFFRGRARLEAEDYIDRSDEMAIPISVELAEGNTPKPSRPWVEYPVKS